MRLRLAFRRVLSSRFAPLCLFAGLILFAATVQLHAQEPSSQETAAMDRIGKYKLINFGIFAIVLGYAIARYSPRFFNARSADIRKAIEDATGLKLEADYRYSEIDRKMATLAEAVRRMREQARLELDQEHQRFRAEAQSEIDHIQQNVANEIDALRKQGATQVRRHTAQLALSVAERRLQDRFSGGEPEDLIHDFVHLVESGKE